MGFTLRGRWAVVTGASAGIGRAIARELAARGCHLFLVARRDHLLQELAVELISNYAIEVKWYALDLGSTHAADLLFEQAVRHPISLVINNAGFAVAGPFDASDWSKTSQMIELNIRFLTHFCYRMLPHLRALAEGGRILNVGSIAGYQGVPNMAAYAASKAYVNHFSEGLNWELRGTKIAVTCLEPGQTASEFFEVAGIHDTQMANTLLLSCEAVACQGIDAMIKGKPRHVAGWLNKLLIFSLRFSPRSMVRMVISRLFKDMGVK